MKSIKLRKLKHGNFFPGYAQKEGSDFGENCVLVMRMKSIRIAFTYLSYKKVIVYEMDVKKTFLNGYLEEEVYIEQPKGFESSGKPDSLYHLNKALYGLKVLLGLSVLCWINISLLMALFVLFLW